MKKLFFLFVLTILPLAASADAVEIDGIYYKLNADAKTAEVTEHPQKYSGEINIPETVMFESVMYSVTSIGQYSFSECSDLSLVIIPISVTSIEKYAFYECTNLTTISIPNSVTSIGESAYFGCSSLASVTIPSSVTSISEKVFSNCSSLISIIVEKGNTIYDSRDNCNAIIETRTNTLIAGCKNSIVPNTVASIGQASFYRCASLISIEIPNNVSNIGSNAFEGCTSLESVSLSNSLTSIGESTFAECICLNIETLPNNITSIGKYAFDACYGITSFVIPNKVTSIGDGAFEGCKNLISIEIPNSVTSIGDGAFAACKKLTSIEIPNSVKTIGIGTFYQCEGLASVSLPDNLTCIKRNAFAFCSSLASVEIPNSVTRIEEGAFVSCSSLTSVNISNGITIIEESVFSLCTSLISVIIPNGVNSIENCAFKNCTSLTSIIIPNSVKSIGSEAFGFCGSLTSLDIPNSVTSIGSEAFEYCSGLTSINLPCDLTRIETRTFWNCIALPSVTIPRKVTYLGALVFESCSSLSEINCMATVPPETRNRALEWVDFNKTTLYVPLGSKEKYTEVAPWSKFKNIEEKDFDVFLFPDCPSGEVRDAAIYLYHKGIVEGEEGLLYADREATRAEVSKVSFYGAYFGPMNIPAELAVDNFPSVYTDLQDNTSYYYRPAKALLYLEYGDGVAPFDRNRLAFEPEDKIARTNVLKELMETFNIKPESGYISKAATLGIITSSENFRPYDNCTRGEAFLMLARIMQKIEAGEIDDPNPQESDYFEPLNTTLKTISLGANLQMGNFQHYTKTSFALSGVVPLAFAHTYNSYNTTLPSVFFGDKSKTDVDDSYLPLGDGWSHNFHSFITVVGDYQNNAADNGLRVIVHWGGGDIDVYKSDGTKLVPESMGIYDEMEYAGGDELTIKSKSQIEYLFSKQGGSGAAVFYLSSVKDRNGNTLTINYEDGLNGSKRIKSVSDGHRSLDFTYLSDTDLLSEVNDPLNRAIKFDYFDNEQTGKKQLKSFTDAEGNTTTYEYADLSKVGTSKLLSRIQLPKGNYIENEYDANCRLKNTVRGVDGVPTTKTSVSVTANYGKDAISTQSKVDVGLDTHTSSYNYTFNQNNVVIMMTGAMDLYVNSSYNYQFPELPKAIKTNNVEISNVSYDSKGNVTKFTIKGDGTLTTTMTYDKMNNLTSRTDPMGNKTTFRYDGNGNLTKVSAPEGVTASISVNSKGLPTETSNAMGVKTQYDYNDYGNLIKTTLPALGLSSTAVYDAASRLTSATDALGRTRSFVYNNNDYLTSETDAMDHTTKYSYDANDNLTSITNAKGGVTTMSYDNATDWLLSVEFAGSKKQYDYNKDGTLSTFTKPDGTTLNYSYDELGRITSDGVNSYSYDNKLRLSEISDGSKSVSFTYDGFNRITGTSYDGTSNSYSYDKNGNCMSVNDTQYSYDGLNRLTSVSFSGGTINYTYRKDSKLEKVEYPNGMTTTFDYDEVGRLTGKQTKLSNGTVIVGYSYILDKVGNITKQTSQEPYTDIVLPNEKTNYSYNDGNRITKAGDISFEFDANGNTTKRGSESYSWDKKDRLTSAGSTAIKYDPLGLIASYGDITFTTDPLGMGNVLSDSKSGAEYIYGNGLEARVKDGKTNYYVTDVRGSVVAIVDEEGNITHKYQYDEFGKVVQKEEADYNPFQYVGKYGVMALNDHQYYMRARHYDPTNGRFLSEDPIWSTNLYPYADNNPIMGIDPRGRKKYGYMTDQWFHFDYYGEYDTYTGITQYYKKKDGKQVDESEISQSVKDEIYEVTRAMAEADEYELVPKSNGRLVITKKGTGYDHDVYTGQLYSEKISSAARGILVKKYMEDKGVDNVEIVKGFEYDRFIDFWFIEIDVPVSKNPGASLLGGICSMGNPNCQ